MKLLHVFMALSLSLLVLTSAMAADRKSVDIHSIQADFIQEKHLKILKKPLISTGSFTFVAPRSLRWEYFTPIPSVLLMHDGTIEKYTKQDGTFIADRGMRLDGMQLVLSEIGNWLDGRFTESEMFQVSFPDDNTVLLEPREATPTSIISRIELQLADRHGLLDSVKIVEGPDSFTTMTFHNRILNQDIPSSVFRIK